MGTNKSKLIKAAKRLSFDKQQRDVLARSLDHIPDDEAGQIADELNSALDEAAEFVAEQVAARSKKRKK